MNMNIIILSGALLVVIGFIGLILGMIVLVRKALSREVAEVTSEAAKLAKKGLLTDVGSSLESASFLVKEMTELIKTERGIGLILIIVGILLVAGGLAIFKNFI